MFRIEGIIIFDVRRPSNVLIMFDSNVVFHSRYEVQSALYREKIISEDFVLIDDSH